MSQVSTQKNVLLFLLLVCLIGTWVTGPKHDRKTLRMTIPQIYRESRDRGLKVSIACKAFTAATIIILILCNVT